MCNCGIQPHVLALWKSSKSKVTIK